MFVEICSAVAADGSADNKVKHNHNRRRRRYFIFLSVHLRRSLFSHLTIWNLTHLSQTDFVILWLRVFFFFHASSQSSEAAKYVIAADTIQELHVRHGEGHHRVS